MVPLVGYSMTLCRAPLASRQSVDWRLAMSGFLLSISLTMRYSPLRLAVRRQIGPVRARPADGASGWPDRPTGTYYVTFPNDFYPPFGPDAIPCGRQPQPCFLLTHSPPVPYDAFHSRSRPARPSAQQEGLVRQRRMSPRCRSVPNATNIVPPGHVTPSKPDRYKSSRPSSAGTPIGPAYRRRRPVTPLDDSVWRVFRIACRSREDRQGALVLVSVGLLKKSKHKTTVELLVHELHELHE